MKKIKYCPKCSKKMKKLYNKFKCTKCDRVFAIHVVDTIFVKIIKATRKSYWYADKIGLELEVEPLSSDSPSFFVVIDPGKYSSCSLLIHKKDCERI